MRVPLFPLAQGGVGQSTYEWETAASLNWMPSQPHKAEPHQAVLSPTASLSTGRVVTSATGIYGMTVGYTTAGAERLLSIGNRRVSEHNFSNTTETVYSGGPIATPTYLAKLPFAAGGPDTSQAVLADDLGSGVPWLVNLSTQAISSLSGAIPALGSVTFVGQRFVGNVPYTPRFRWSALNDGSSWPAANVATAESQSDDCRHCDAFDDMLVVLGPASTEFWGVTGDANSPYQRIAGATVRQGTGLGASVAVGISELYCYTADRRIAAIKPGSYRIISTRGMEAYLASVVADLRSFGHFVYLAGKPTYLFGSYGSVGDVVKVFAYDIDSGEWYEWGTWTSVTGSVTTADILAAAHAPNSGVVCFGSRTGTTVYTTPSYMSADTSWAHRHITPNVSHQGVGMIWHEVRAQFAGTVSGAKKAYLSYSDDGGATFSTRQEFVLPTTGSFSAQPARWSQLGKSRERCWRIETDPGNIHLVEMWGEVEVLRR